MQRQERPAPTCGLQLARQGLKALSPRSPPERKTKLPHFLFSSQPTSSTSRNAMHPYNNGYGRGRGRGRGYGQGNFFQNRTQNNRTQNNRRNHRPNNMNTYPPPMGGYSSQMGGPPGVAPQVMNQIQGLPTQQTRTAQEEMAFLKWCMAISGREAFSRCHPCVTAGNWLVCLVESLLVAYASTTLTQLQCNFSITGGLCNFCAADPHKRCTKSGSTITAFDAHTTANGRRRHPIAACPGFEPLPPHPAREGHYNDLPHDGVEALKNNTERFAPRLRTEVHMYRSPVAGAQAAPVTNQPDQPQQAQAPAFPSPQIAAPSHAQTPAFSQPQIAAPPQAQTPVFSLPYAYSPLQHGTFAPHFYMQLPPSSSSCTSSEVEELRRKLQEAEQRAAQSSQRAQAERDRTEAELRRRQQHQREELARRARGKSYLIPDAWTRIDHSR